MVLVFILRHGTHLELKQLLSMVSCLPGYRLKKQSIHFSPKTKVAVETKKLTMF